MRKADLLCALLALVTVRPVLADEVHAPAPATTPAATVPVMAQVKTEPPPPPAAPIQAPQGGPGLLPTHYDRDDRDAPWQGRVMEVWVEDARNHEGGLGNVVSVRLGSGELHRLRERSEHLRRPFGLILGGRFMKGLKTLISVNDPDTLRFMLERNDDNKDAWIALLGGWALGSKSVLVSVGLDDGNEVARSMSELRLRMLRSLKAIPIGCAMVLFLAVMGYLGRKTTLLRDSGSRLDGRRLVYSLGRTHMAFWFVNVVFGFLFIWAVTSVASTISTSMMTLMGIGFATALGAAVIDDNKNGERLESGEGLGDLLHQRDKLLKDRADLLAQPQHDEKVLAALERDIKALDGKLNPASEGFIRDILTDANGFSLHRVQLVVWALVLMVLYWGSVLHNLMMPEFDSTVLGVMGISAGTYLGFKLPEKKA